MASERNTTASDLQLSVAHEALRRARFAVGAQAEMLAEQMERGTVPCFDGPDALRLFAMILGDDTMRGADGNELPTVLTPLQANAHYQAHPHLSMKS